MINLIKDLVTAVLIVTTVASVAGSSVVLSAFTVNYVVLGPMIDSNLLQVAGSPSLADYVLVAGATITVCLLAYLCFSLYFTVLCWVSLQVWRWAMLCTVSLLS